MPRTKIGECKLCKNHTSLSRSHIIPEYYYKGVYDDSRMIVVEGDLDNSTYAQKGVRDHLLCSVCEGEINRRYELPFIKEVYSRIPRVYYHNRATVNAIDAKLFKLFHMSILWRMCLAQGVMWENVKGLGIENDLFDGLSKNDESKCPWLRIQATALIDEFGFLSANFVTKPCVIDVVGVPVVYSCWGGLEWYYSLRCSTDRVISEMGGTDPTKFPLLVMHFGKSVSVQGFIRAMRSQSESESENGVG